MIKVTVTEKNDFTPSGRQVTLASYDISGTQRISGAMMWPFVYECKLERVRYTKLFFNVETGKVMGRKNEVQPWEEVADFDLERRVL